LYASHRRGHYRVVAKPGCTAAVAAIGFATWRLEANELMLVGRTGTWRFFGKQPDHLGKHATQYGPVGLGTASVANFLSSPSATLVIG
jgi:hypothetical protein